MKKELYWIHFNKDDALDNADEIIWYFGEATPEYDTNEVRFYGTPERLQEFLRALRQIGEEDFTVA